MKTFHDYLPLIPVTEYGKPHLLRYARSAEWIAPWMEQATRVLELGGPSPFTDLLAAAWPWVTSLHTGEADLRQPLECQSSSMDLVLCMEVIEHIKDTEAVERAEFAGDGIQTCLAEAYRVLKPGGWFFLTTPNLTCWHSVGRLIHSHHPFFFDQHPRELAPEDVRGYLQAAGFGIARIETLDVWGQHGETPQQLLRIREAVLSCGGSEHQRGDCLFVLARKP